MYLVLLVSINVEAQVQCVLRNGLNKRQCDILGRFGCPVRFLGRGCKSPTGVLLRDGGCQPSNSCSFCCPQSCLAARKLDRSCTWSASSNACFSCWNGGVANNGGPAIPGATAVLPADWSLYGLGDSFTIYPTCNPRGQHITGVNLWLAETDPTKANDPLVDIDIWIVLFHRDSGFLVGEWTGTCTSHFFQPRKPLRNAALYQIRRVNCDFTKRGTILFPGPCQVPSLPHGSYEIMFQHSGSPTLGWVQSLENTGCDNAECSFSQQMANDAYLPRFDLCEMFGTRLENFAFQVLGSARPPVISQCRR